MMKCSCLGEFFNLILILPMAQLAYKPWRRGGRALP